MSQHADAPGLAWSAWPGFLSWCLQWWPSAHKAVEEEPGKLPLVVLHPNLDASVLLQLRELGPVYEVRGLPANPAALARANAKKARRVRWGLSIGRSLDALSPCITLPLL